MFLYKIIVSCILNNDQDSAAAADSLLQLKRRGNLPRRGCRHELGISHNYNHSCNHSNFDHNDNCTYLIEKIYVCEKCTNQIQKRKFGNHDEKWKISLSSDALNDLESCCFADEKLWLTSSIKATQRAEPTMYAKLPVSELSAKKVDDVVDLKDDFNFNFNSAVANHKNISVVHVGSNNNLPDAISLSSTTDCDFYDKKLLSRHQSCYESNSSKKFINNTTCRWLNGKEDINQRPECLHILSKNSGGNQILSPPVQFKDKKCYNQLYQRYLVRKSISGYNYYNYYYVKHSKSLDDKNYCCDNRSFLTSISTLYSDGDSDVTENLNFPRSPSPILNKRKVSRDVSYSRIPFSEKLSNELVKEANLVLNYCSKNSIIDDNLPVSNHASISPSSSSSSSDDVWFSTRDRSYSGSLNVKNSELQSPQDTTVHLFANTGGNQNDQLNSRPGSAPTVNELDVDFGTVNYQRQPRSMSLPQTYLTEISETALMPTNEQKNRSNKERLIYQSRSHHHHHHNYNQNRNCYYPFQQQYFLRNSLVENASRDEIKKITTNGDRRTNFKSLSSPQLSSNNDNDFDRYFDRSGRLEELTDIVTRKFQKSFSLRFQKPKKSVTTTDQNHKHQNQSFLENSQKSVSDNGSTSDVKYKFGPLVWRSSKERKKRSRALRNAKCNSGDSGIQLEVTDTLLQRTLANIFGIMSGNSCDNDSCNMSDGFDSPMITRRFDLINRALNHNCKVDIENRKYCPHLVRRTNSDVSQHRFSYESSLLSRNIHNYYNYNNSSSDSNSNTNSINSSRMQNSIEESSCTNSTVRCRTSKPVPESCQRSSSYLRRSLSQPIDIDKLLVYSTPKGDKGLSDFQRDFTDEENSSDTDSSITTLSNGRKKSLDMVMDEESVPILAEALFDHIAIENDELGFNAGDVIEVLEMVNKDWWWGSANNRDGWFPSASVRLKVNQEETVEDCIAAMTSGKPSSTKLNRRTSISLLSNDQVRSSVVKELVQTERDFVKVLTDIVQGYLNECRLRTDLFTNEDLMIIFMNVEDILEFQTKFLKNLESCINWSHFNQSSIGRCFLEHHSGFLIYSEYCNRHPMASVKLQELYQYKKYCDFFENCRLMRNLHEIPLDGYLLTPIQRICKYPLQLAELLKYTKAEHDDYCCLKKALNVMKDVATVINERKRRLESLQKLIVWQDHVDGWEGEDLIESSSQLIHQGEVIRVTNGMWTNSVTLFLFDHQIIYCRKDILKRNTYIYKGRICLDSCEVIDVPNGKDQKLGVNVRHGLKVYCYTRDKWLLFCCRSANDKHRWLEALKNERDLVQSDERNDFKVSKAAKSLAKMAAVHLEDRPPFNSKYRDFKNYKRHVNYMGSNLHLQPNNSGYSFGRKVGSWLTFGSNKRTRH